MSSIVPVLLSNAVFAAVLSLLAIVLTKVWRNPHLAHALWALVLLKLITPPLAEISVPQQWLPAHSSSEHVTVDGATSLAASSEAERIAPPAAVDGSAAVDPSDLGPVSDAAAFPVSSVHAPRTSPVTSPTGETARASHPNIVGVIWTTGAVLAIGLLAWRCFRFRKLLVAAEDADGETTAAAVELSARLGLRRCPPVRTVTAPIPPLVWSLGWSPVVLLPVSLLKVLEPAQRRAVIAHELAHIQRGDHWMRWLEVLATVAFWWYPVVWLARRRLREAEEECCDAWVVWVLPAERRSYGQAMLKTIEFLTDGPAVPTLAGSAFGRSYYQRRFEMIMQQKGNRKASKAALLTAALLAVVALPLVAQTEKGPGNHGASPGSSDLFDSNITQATDSRWELGLEVSRPAGLRDSQQAAKQQAVAAQRRALAVLHQLAEEELSLVESNPSSSVDADKLKKLVAELEKIQRQVNALTSAQQPVDETNPDGLQFTKPLDPKVTPDAKSTPSLEAVWERIATLEQMLKDLQKAQADGRTARVAPLDPAPADSAMTIRDRITLDSAVVPSLPSFEVSPHEDEQRLQERLLELDVESAKRTVIAAQRSLERLSQLGDAVSARLLDEQRDALAEKEIQLQRAETILALFSLQAKRQRDQAKRREELRSRFTQPTLDAGTAPPEK